VVAAALGLVALGPLPPVVPAAEAAPAATPAGFRDETVFSGLTSPTAVEFSPDGRVFVAEKSGIVKVFDGLADRTPTVFADLRTNVLNQWDRGLLGLALDPGFPADPYVYVLYTYDALPGGTAPQWGSPGGTSDPCPSPPGFTDDGCVASGRLSRLRAAGNVMTGTEQVLVQDWCQQYPSHSIGGLAFGPDGALYASGGDGASFDFIDYGQDGNPTNPCGDPPLGTGKLTPPTAEGGALRSQDLRTAGDPVGLDGSVVRVDPATGAGAAGNPLASSTDPNARRIIATGLRNPFRIAFRPGTSELWVGDVGYNNWEEINRITDRFGAVENFGWPCYEGDGRQGGYDAANLDICERLYTSGGATPPWFAYTNANFPPGATCDSGRTVSGLAFYTGTSYPAAYRGALFYSDYSRGCIYVMPQGASGEPDRAAVQSFASVPGPVSLRIGPGGDLFYVSFFGSIHRISYSTNTAPQAVVRASPQTGASPLTVSFDGTSSSDPDGDAITYAWDLDDDGDFDDGTGATASWTYATDGDKTARLRVTDSRGASGTASTEIVVGGEPSAVIDAPPAGTTFAVGDRVTFSGHGSDPQDGALPASALAWGLVLHHCSSATVCHEHGIGLWSGVAGATFTVPDHQPPSYFELTLTVRDSTGLTSSVTRRIDLQTVTVTVDSDPDGVSIGVGDGTATAPTTVTAFVGSRISLSAPLFPNIDGRAHRFDRWSDGGAASHEVVAPATPTTYRAFYSPK
jgi:glucose/arabinose dehydrogenase/PKD repeat protein